MPFNWRHGRGSGETGVGKGLAKVGSKPAPTRAGRAPGGGFSSPVRWAMLAGALAAGGVGAMPALAQSAAGGQLGQRDEPGNGASVAPLPPLPAPWLSGLGISRQAESGSGQQDKKAAARHKAAPNSDEGEIRSQEDAGKTTYSPKATTGSPGHIFWVIPAFKVNYGSGFEPLTPKEKFQEWAQSSYDPLGLTVGAFEAGTLEYSHSDGFCGYGVGAANYGWCFGSLELDATDSSFIGDFVLPVLWHQDPRYFRLGEGGFGRRVWWAVSRVFVTYNDSGHTVFYSSALTGTVVASALSNLYYPSQDVGVGHTMSRIGIDLGNTALYNLAAEFWPDIDHKIHRIF